jgi:hypothetical protein
VGFTVNSVNMVNSSVSVATPSLVAATNFQSHEHPKRTDGRTV